MSISATLPETIKAKYRKVKTVPGAVKAVVYGGAADPAGCIQFQRDVQTYNLYEALLYVENYEQDGYGYFAKGTAEAAAKLLK